MPVRLQGRRTAAALVEGVPQLLVTVLIAAAAAAYWHQDIPPERALRLTILAMVFLALLTLALVDLERLVLVVVFCAMVFPQSLVSPGGSHVALCDLLLVFAIGAWIAWFAVRRRPIPWIRSNPYLPAALAFAAVTLVSVLWSRNWQATVKQVFQITEIVVVVPIVFASVPRSLERIRQALVTYVVFTTGLSLVVFFYFIRRAAAGDLSPEYLPGMHKNATGGFLGVGCVLAYGLWLEGSRSRWVIWLLPIEVAGLFGTISRGAMVGTAVAVVFLSLVMARRRLLTLAIVGAASLVFLVTIQWKLPGTHGGGYTSQSTRPLSYAGGIHWIEAHPLLGTGAGTYLDYLPTVHIGLTDPNNLFLLTWAELGIFGLGILLFLLYRVGRLVAAVRVAPPPAAAIGLTVAAGAVANLVHFQFDTTWSRGTATITFALVGLLLAVVRLAPEPAAVAPPPIAAPRRRRLVARPEAPEMSSLRVLQVVASSELGGIERHVVRLAQGLRERDVDCRIACPFTARELRRAAALAAVPVVPAAGRGAWMGQVARLAETYRPQVVHVHDHAGAVAAWQLAESTGARFVRTEHSVRPADEQVGLRARATAILQRAVDQRADVLLAVSQAVADSLDPGAAAGAVSVVPVGIDLPSDVRVERRLRHADQLTHPTAVYSGELVATKELDLLLLALARVRARVRDFQLVLAGTGRGEAGLRQQARELGLEQAIEWLGNVRHLPDAFQRAQFAVIPYPIESTDPFAAEAMAWGLSVVAARSVATEQLIADGLSGLLFRPGDVRELADALILLAGDRQRAETFGWAARHVALELFAVDTTISRTIEIYQAAVARPRPAAG